MDTISKTGAAAFPRVRFVGKWRAYQARVLAELEGHLDDARLNIVAAPGAGKTVLGLEVVCRLGRPTLILSPTRAIRDQWLARLFDLFEAEDGNWPAGWGTRIATPGWITSTTYQSLHAALRGLVDEDEADESAETEDADDERAEEDSKAAEMAAAGEALLQALDRAGIETLVLDEAHHLRRAWWESLQDAIAYLQERRPGLHVVSLTATPPYDVEPAEWDRYAEICGPVDAEISIPELVKQGDLCPHQDFVHFSVAEEAVIASLEAFAREVEQLAYGWARDPVVLAWVREHDWIAEPEAREAEILARPGAYCGLLAVMKSNGQPLPSPGPEILGIKAAEVPAPGARVLEALFQEIVIGEPPFSAGEMGERLRRELRAVGALWRRRVRLRKSEHLARALTGTAAKLDSIEAIARAEAATLGEGLRLVVLTDYVRAAAITRPADQSSDALGAGPILRRLGQAGLAPLLRPAMVTGSWVVIPDTVIPDFRVEAIGHGLAETELTFQPLPHIPGWSRVLVEGGKTSRRLQVVTSLFEQGSLRCLVGTAALLGEGWDAPATNSLVLATSVKSYMLSNQMRGRAIRKSKRHPHKVAAIWHLATILPPGTELLNVEESLWDLLRSHRREALASGTLDEAPSRLGYDAIALFRRFAGFAGVSHTQPPVIESGIIRLGIETRHWTVAAVRDWNAVMLKRAADRAAVARAWSEVFFDAGKLQKPTTGAVLPPPEGPKGIRRVALGWALAGLIGALFQVALLSLHTLRAGWRIALVVLGLGLLGAALYHSRAIWYSITAGSPRRYMVSIGRCLLDALSVADVLDQPRRTMDVRVEEEGGPGDRTYCRLSGSTHLDEVRFAEASVTFFGEIGNPRHILIRYHRRGFVRQVDYHAIPAEISASKEALKMLERSWSARLGRCEIVNTRTREGRLFLLRARVLSYSSVFKSQAKRKQRWE
ncbi:DEAD/DEAH box helicase family protein [Pelagibius marinus]|uniref:DEAD/DEAH box helicase family protein n=1 Tax=Pelagibius marinus TaxID=2762760 RepID=UPI0018722CA6|nr:DEAD/DEAH box helicase family protein [Pelagibius marinus]